MLLVGQAMVAPFLFYSGYGVVESINKKGLPYLKQFPVRRILSTLFKFSCAVMIFFLIGVLITGQSFSVKQVLLSLVGWESLGNSNWYIFVILVLYFITYVAYRFLFHKNRVVPLTATCMSVAALAVVNTYCNVKPVYWVDTVLCYAAGMIYAQYRKKIEYFINMHNAVYYVFTVLALAATVFFKKFGGNILFYLSLNVCFVIALLLLTMRITVKNKILVWCGKNLFELYILQRIPMIIFKETGLAAINVYLYFVVSLIATLALVQPFKYITNKLWEMILKTPLLFRCALHGKQQ